MIPKDYLQHWQAQAPWTTPEMVEQDLVISRALTSLYQDELLREKIAFKGGTALNKLFIQPAARYSEDIDLSLINDEPIGNILTAIRNAIDPWLGKSRYSTRKWLTKFIYKFESSSGFPLRLKIELNISESLNILPYQRMSYQVNSPWFKGEANITTFSINELMATKLRALYQRRKGRDLFDLWKCITSNHLDTQQLVNIFLKYNEHNQTSISRAQFEKNLTQKMENDLFIQDVAPLLRPDTNWRPKEAFELVMDEIVSLIPGEPWQGLISTAFQKGNKNNPVSM